MSISLKPCGCSTAVPSTVVSGKEAKPGKNAKQTFKCDNCGKNYTKTLPPGQRPILRPPHN